MLPPMKALGGVALAVAGMLAGCAKSERAASKHDVEARVPAASEPEALPPDHADAHALGELIAAAPKARAAPTDPRGGTLIGTESGASARPAESAAPRASAELKVE